ncbi:VCBS repeat-containing protein [Candidatus Sumerlaeota bacterium]|nr:VCBS repeat-containing protein [Candidatus Sumerlaeota bacterium]
MPLLIVCAAARLDGSAAPAYDSYSLEVKKERSALLWAKINDDDLADLIVADDSKIYIYYQIPDKGFSAVSMQTLGVEGDSALFDLADLDHDGRSEIIMLRADGVTRWSYDKQVRAVTKDPKPLVSDVRGVAVQHLAFADFMFDIDSDGDEDIVYPLDGKYYLYFNDNGAFTKKNQLSAKPIRVKVTMGEPQLRDAVETSMTIPRLAFVDLNGDGKLDLRASTDNKESFYIQDAHGIIPENPSYEVDLKRFKDQVIQHDSDVKIDQFQFIPADLNGDKREDYLIVASNKIWVFKATDKGVDFSKPDQIVKVSAEYMTVVLLPLNEDDRPDLLILKYQLPSLGRLVAGLAIGIRFEIEFLGYNNVTDTVFSRRPDYRSTMVFKIPPILKLLGELDDIARQFKDMDKRAHSMGGGDFDGDGIKDVAKVEGDSLNLYFTPPTSGNAKTDYESDFGDYKFFQKTLFSEKSKDVPLDSLINFFSNTLDEFLSGATAGRKPSVQIPLDQESARRARGFLCRDLNSDGRDDPAILLSPPLDKDGKEDEDLDTQTMKIWISGK